jgi:hypothetical protein
MSDPIKAPRADAKLKRLADDVQEQLYRYVNQPAVTQMDGIAWLEREHSVKTSAGAFSEWLSWFSARQRAREREQRVNVFLSDERQMHPELSDEELFQRGQRLMTLLTIGEEDPKSWAMVQRTKKDWEDARLAQQKFKEQLKSDLDRGLEALYEHIKGNPAALAAFQALQGVVTNATK